MQTDGLLGRVTKARVSFAGRRRAKVAAGAERRQVALGNAEHMEGAHLAYETFHHLPLGTLTFAQIERSSAGIAGWAEYASVIESDRDQRMMGLLKDCQVSDVADNARKADENWQRLLKNTGIIDMIGEHCSSRSATPASRSRLGGLPTSGINLCETVDADGLEINMNKVV